MADKTFHCTLITPVDRLLDAQATYASVPMWDGQRGVMHDTSALVGKLGPGELCLSFETGPDRTWFIEGGFMQVVANRLTILATGCVPAEQLDRAEVNAELAEAVARKATTASEMDALTEQRNRLRAKARVASAR